MTDRLSFNRNLSRTVSYVPLLLMSAYPFLCRYDVSKSTLWYYDFLSMNGNVLWFSFLIVAVTLVGVWRKNDVPLPCLLAIVLLFSVAEVLTNYPMIWRDVFLHGSAVKGITSQGHIGGTWENYPETHPGFFLLWSIVTLVTSVGIFESNLLLLLPVAVMLLIMLLILIYRRLSIGIVNGATLMAFLLMNFNMNEFMFLHFNTRLLSLIYALVFLFLFLNEKNARERVIGLLATNIALVISHILNSLVPIVFFAVYLLSKWKRARSTASLFLSCAIIYIAWNLYVGYARLSEGLTTFLNYYYVILDLELVYGWSPVQARPQPFFGLVLGTYFKVLLVTLALISLYSAIKLRRQRRVKLLAFYLLSVCMVYGFSFFSVLGWISAHRGIIFGSVALASLPTILLTSTAKNNSKPWKRTILIIAIIISVIPHFILVHEPPFARCESVGSVAQTSDFILKHRNGQPIVSVNDFPAYYCFYEPFYQGYDNLQLDGSSWLNNIANFLVTRPKPSLRIVDYRQTVDWAWALGRAQSYNQALREWDREVYAKLDERYNIIYGTGLETIYN